MTGISLVVDSGWAFADKEQTVQVAERQGERLDVLRARADASRPSAGMNPAQACKKLRADMGADAFRTAYGTNRNGAERVRQVRVEDGADEERRRAHGRRRADRRLGRPVHGARRVDRGKGHGKGKGHDKAKGEDKDTARGRESLAACLKRSV